MTGTRLILIRHAESAGSTGRCIRHTDLALSESGQRALRRLTAADGELADLIMRPTAWRAHTVIRSSDLTGASDTASAIAAMVSLPLMLDARLREMHFGEWEGRDWKDLETSDGVRLSAWMSDWTEQAPPGGETVAELVARADAVLAELRHSPPQTVVIVSHAGWIRAALCRLRDKPIAEMFEIAVPNVSVTIAALQTIRDDNDAQRY
jgi:broad specificity phosphatase PhoE